MLHTLKQKLAQEIHEIVSRPVNDLVALMEVPRDIKFGQVALPVFRWAKEWKKAPPIIAQELAQKVKEMNVENLSQVTAVGGFVNFQFEDTFVQSLLFNECFDKGKDIGGSNVGAGKTIVIDFSSPNIAKPMSVGHLRATVIGQSIYNIAKSQGFNVVGVNHLGDWGVQFGRLALAYQMWSEEYDFSGNAFQSLFDMYVRFHEEMKTQPELEKQGSLVFKKLENGDQEIKKLWEMFIDISIKEYNKIYKLLGVTHDEVLGESFYNDKMKPTEELLSQKGLLEESDGAMVVKLDEYDMPPCLIRKSDGASLYATRDLACALYRREQMRGDQLLYVVGVDQGLHFQQVFKVLEKMGYDWAKSCKHIAFGMYKFGENKMSTRKGNVIFLKDIVDKAIALCAEVIEEKNPTLLNKEEVARQVGLGAVIFNDLAGDSIKDVKFDWDRVLDFEGDSGPYVQYSGVRCKSLLEKFGQELPRATKVALSSLEERALVRLLLSFPEVVATSYQNFKPHYLANYLLDLSKSFNNFYHKCQILKADDEVKQARMLLVHSTHLVIEKALNLLNIELPNRM